MENINNLRGNKMEILCVNGKRQLTNGKNIARIKKIERINGKGNAYDFI